jgi:hypothetical protein
MVIYGIRNCDTMKKARAWLDSQGHLRLPRLRDIALTGRDVPQAARVRDVQSHRSEGLRPDGCEGEWEPAAGIRWVKRALGVPTYPLS